MRTLPSHQHDQERVLDRGVFTIRSMIPRVDSGSSGFCLVPLGEPVMDDDPWIEQNSRIEPEKLHALGVVTLNWNSAEFSLFWLFCTVSGLDGEKARIITHDLQTPTIQQKVRDLLPKSKLVSDPIKEHIEFGLTALDICRINRNQFTHFMPGQNKGGCALHRNKGPGLDLPEIPSDIATIRRVADEIGMTGHFLTAVANSLSERRGNILKALGEPLWPTLPDKFSLPEKIWKPQRPSQSSQT